MDPPSPTRSQIAAALLHDLRLARDSSDASRLMIDLIQFDYEDDENRTVLFAEMGGIPIIIDAMMRHGGDASVQERGCVALATIASWSTVNARKIVDNRGTQVVLDAMGRHECVQREATWASLEFVKIASGTVFEHVGARRGIQLVIQAMRQSLADAIVQCNCCLVLARVARDSHAHRNLIVDNDGIHGIINGMRQHLDNVLVQKCACNILHNLGMGNDDLCETVGRTGGISVLVAAMDRHSHDESLQERCCLILLVYARIEFNLEEIAIMGGIPVIIQAMIRYANSDLIPGVCHAILELLAADWSRTFCHFRGLGP